MEGRPILLSSKDVQEVFGISANTLREWRKHGLPHVMVGNQPLFFHESVVDWLKDQQIANVSPLGI